MEFNMPFLGILNSRNGMCKIRGNFGVRLCALPIHPAPKGLCYHSLITHLTRSGLLRAIVTVLVQIPPLP